VQGGEAPIEAAPKIRNEHDRDYDRQPGGTEAYPVL
jgi:hypothetical protein